eukprot:386736-Hanusia_phi.AAC.2
MARHAPDAHAGSLNPLLVSCPVPQGSTMLWAFFRKKEGARRLSEVEAQAHLGEGGSQDSATSENSLDVRAASESKQQDPGVFSLLPIDLADKIFVLLDGHTLARMCCCNILFAQHIDCQHPAWRAMQHARYAPSTNDKQRYLEVIRDCCSLCGLFDDIQKELHASRKYFCSTCTFRHADRIREMERFDRHLHRKAVELDTSIRRRNLNPLLQCDLMKELFSSKPLARPKVEHGQSWKELV